jgi:DNA modification methylase
MQIRDRVRELRRVRAGHLTPNPKNWRTHPQAQADALRGILAEVGYADALLARELPDGSLMLVDGHLRAETTPEQEVPVLVLDIDEAEADKLLLSLDPLAALAETNAVALDALLREVDTGSEGLQQMYADLAEAAELYQDDAKEIVEDEIPDPPADPITKPGDLWILGEHRLLCGDSTKAEDVEQLMAGAKADMVWTDPPYGIAYSSKRWENLGPQSQGLSAKRNNAPMIAGDDKPFDPSFLLATFPGAREMFVWGFQYYPDKLGRGGIIVWNKKKESQSECAHGDFELCWSREERNKMCWLTWGGFKNKEQGEERLHTTQKPVALAAWFFNNWGRPGDVVADCFLGSGTTLIAAEQLGRKCYGMEISPAYCDVIVKRWETLTGKKATREEVKRGKTRTA